MRKMEVQLFCAAVHQLHNISRSFVDHTIEVQLPLFPSTNPILGTWGSGRQHW